MDAVPPPAPTGFVAALRMLADGLLAGVQDRLELFSLDLQEEKFRLIQIFVWISAAIFAGVMAIAFAEPHAGISLLGECRGSPC